ncbi:Sodium/hydrogen exchanger family domain containing protein [Amanita muscaria]
MPQLQTLFSTPSPLSSTALPFLSSISSEERTNPGDDLFIMQEFSSTVIDLVQSRATAPDEGGLLSGKDPTAYNPNDPLRIWIIQIGLIIGLTSLLSIILKRVRQPKVIAEVLGGIILGPTAFGRIPGFTKYIFPEESQPYLSLTANIGLCLFLFLVGLEIDAGIIKRNWRLSASVALAGMTLPFGLGVAISYPIYTKFIEAGVAWTHFLLFVGVAFSITAFPVLCRILTELKLLDTTVGIVVLSAGVGNDIVGWVLLALSIALVNAGSGLTALYILIICVAWTLILLFPVKMAFKWLAMWTGSIENGPTLFYMTAILLFTFGSAFLTDVIGVHAIFGAFLTGVIVPREGGLAIKFTEKLEDIVSIIFLPLYFTLSGLSTDLGLLNTGMTWAYTMAIISLAFVGKFGGCFLAARYLAKFSLREAGAVGALMSCKGLVELIVLNVGLSAGILTQRVFSMFVLEALVLTCLTTPLVSIMYPPHVRKLVSSDNPESKHVESSSGRKKKAAQNNRKRRFTVVLDQLEHLPSMMAVTQLIQPASPSPRLTRILSPVTSMQSTAVNSSTESLSDPSAVIVDAFRLIELSDRVSAVMKSSATEYIIHTDPVLSIFRRFGELNDITVMPALSIVPFDDMPQSVSEHAHTQYSDLIMIPWLPPHITSPDDFHSAAHPQQQKPKQSTPGEMRHNPFETLFKSSHTGGEKSASAVHSQFARGVFGKAKTDVALYVDQCSPGLDIPLGRRQHIFLPFFGGPDDRLALDFVVQLCENKRITATVVRITKAELEPPKTLREIENANLLTVASAISTNFPDTVYGQPNAETRLQSDTVDNLAWSKYTKQKNEQARNPASPMTRVEFRELKTSTPLHTALDEASRPSSLDPERNFDRGSPSVQDERQDIEYCRRVLVVVGRSRRLAVEYHGKELKDLMHKHGPVGSEVKKTIGDVGAAFIVAGCGIGLVVLQAAHDA